MNLAAESLGHVAVIGLHCRFPGARNAEEYWQLLRDGREGIERFSEQDLRDSGVEDSLRSHPDFVPAGGILTGADQFDAGFFHTPPREAEAMDPQHRVFLEGCAAALEDAGYNSEAFAGLIGVYAGSSLNTYLLNQYLPGRLFRPQMDDLHTLIASDKDFLATRVSYQLNLRGPSVVVQSTCSTSLVAICQAVKALQNFDCDMALAGGVSVRVPQRRGYLHRPGGILAPDGHCRPFDAQGQGTVFGNGLGIVVLKRLQDALADRDEIHAVVRGAAINNDGSRKVGYTAPAVAGQAEVIALAQSLAEVEPESLSCIEAHGTATPLGDPIEIAALTQVFRATTTRRQYCAVGSVKSNVGHLDAAAGVAGFLKTVLALKHRRLPPSLHFETPNPKIPWEDSPFYVNDHLQSWTANSTPRRAGVSSFGIGGTNAHVILEEAPARPASAPARSEQILVLSARSPAALEENTSRLRGYLQRQPRLPLADVCYTLQVGRREHGWRRFLIARNVPETLTTLASSDARRMPSGCRSAKAPSVAFLFPGQGTQYPGMGAELYRREPLFRERIEQCCEFLQQQCQVDLRPYLLPEVDADLDSLAQSLQATSLAQPALFVIEYALAQLWQSWGVEAEALLGHSVGEYVAATLAGVFSWRDALTLVARRGQLIQELPGGCMLAVMGSAQQIEELLDPDLAVAAINGPALSTISGPQIAIQALQSKLDAQGIAWQALKTSHAFHSAMMEPALPAFLKEVKKVGLNCPNRPFLSNVTGRWITTSQATDPHYWTEHVRATVQFEAGLRGLLAAGHDLLLEVGPGEALTRVAGSVLAESTQTQEEAALAVASMPTATSDSTEASVLLRAAGQLWLRGAELDLAQLSEGEPRRRLSLPTYPFERQRYWQSPSPQATAAARQTPETLRKESDVGQWFYAPTWSQSYTTPRNTPQTQAPWLIFTPRAGVLDLLVEQLRSEPAAVYQVYPGEAYQQLDPCSYSIRPANQEDLQRLLQDLQEWPRTLVHGWLVEKDLELKQTLELGYFSLQLLGEVLQERAPTRDFEIFALSSQLQRVTGQEPIDPARATLLGPCRVLPQESPRLKCRSIDLPETPEAGLIDDLQAELLSSSEAHSVALRGGQRWKLVYQQLPLSTGSAQDSLRPRGVYWITGGLGAIGRTIAQALARDLQARLVLTSRRGIGPEHREFAQSLEACGAEVLLASADAGDRQTMTEVAAEARQRFGIIHGVFHAAGVAGAGVQRRSALEGTAEVFTPKLQGTQILYELLDEATDFLLLCSSLSAELGGLGQTDYCAANAFQDRFALQHARQDGPRILSLNWDTWKDHGMAAEAEVPQGLIRRQQETLALGMDAAEGLAVLWRALATNPARVPAQLLISTHDLTRRGAAAPARISATADPRSTEPPAPAPAYSRPKTIGEYAPPQGSAEQRIASIWEALLGVEPIGRDDDFLELGGHSLLATQVLNRLREHDPDLQITLRQMFDQPTVAGMAALLQETATPSDPDPGPLRESLRDCTAKQATPLLESFLQRSIATLLGRTTAPPISEKLPELASGQLSLDLRYQLQAELPFLLHSAELVGHASIASLAAYLSEELQRHLGRKVAPPIGELLFPVRLANDSSKNSFPAERLRPAVFLLSAPRSGSSLLRLMLSAHPSLFCPPELWLLNFDRLRDWHAHAAAALYRDGLAHAWMELHGIDLEGGRRQVQDWLDQDLSTATVYAQLQDRAGHRRLLDKSPAYALHSATLQRARQLFAAPRFLHLTRHPQAVIESFVSSRFHRLVGEDGEARSIAEAYWRRCNQNIHDLSDDLDPAEVHVLKFEDLVQQPESTLQGLCAFLEVEFHPAVLQPYQHGRMRAGPGDPRLLQHSTVVAAKANAWQQRPAAPLSAATRELADVLRYSSHPLSISRESS